MQEHNPIFPMEMIFQSLEASNKYKLKGRGHGLNLTFLKFDIQ